MRPVAAVCEGPVGVLLADEPGDGVLNGLENVVLKELRFGLGRRECEGDPHECCDKSPLERPVHLILLFQMPNSWNSYNLRSNNNPNPNQIGGVTENPGQPTENAGITEFVAK